MDTDLYYQPENPLLAGKDFSSRNLRALGALRGFAVNPGLDFHREDAKHAKKTRRTLVLVAAVPLLAQRWFHSQQFNADRLGGFGLHPALQYPILVGRNCQVVPESRSPYSCPSCSDILLASSPGSSSVTSSRASTPSIKTNAR